MTQTNFPYTLKKFASGLRFISVPMENSASVTVLVMVGTGSRYETKDINGISHFLEHMMFKGTQKRPGAMDIAHEMDEIGADYNAFTTKEFTGYYAKAAADNLDQILDVISDIFQNSKLDAAEVDKERGVITEEINMYKDDPRRYVSELFEELLYGDHPLGWDTAGEKEIIKVIPQEKFVEYFQTHYFAENTVVAVAGKFDEATIEQKVLDSFSNIRRQTPLKPLPINVEQKAAAIKIFNKESDQSHLILGVRAYDYFDPRYYTMVVLSTILGSGMSSRLFSEVREKRGLAYYVYASADTYADAGYISASAGVDNARLEEAITVILAEFKKISLELVSDKELEKAKKFLTGKMVLGLETSDSLASYYADEELLHGKIVTLEEKLGHIQKVTADDVLALAKDIFRADQLNLALVGPAKNQDKLYSLLNL